MTGTSAFQQTINLLADAAPIFQDPWHLIGSAAAKIAGAEVGVINDIDVILSERDNFALEELWSDRDVLAVEPSSQFRSRVFHRFSTPLTVEAMSCFELKNAAGEWKRIAPRTRVQFGKLYAPDITEQISIMKLMGRQKDAPRIAALEVVLGQN